MVSNAEDRYKISSCVGRSLSRDFIVCRVVRQINQQISSAHIYDKDDFHLTCIRTDINYFE